MKSFVAKWIIRAAVFRAPADRRPTMRSEWEAEVTRELRSGGGWGTVRSALGAFSDARAMRHIERSGRRATPDGFLTRWSESLAVSFRSLLRAPGFSAVSILTLAIGLGSSAAIYTLLDRILFDPLPYPDAERLVNVDNQVPGAGPDVVWWLSTAQWVFYTDNATSLDALGIYSTGGATVITASGPQRNRTATATHEVLGLLGGTPRLGRLIQEADDQPGAPQTVVVSEGFWRDQLGGNPDAIGSSVSMAGEPYEIIGVLEGSVRLPGGSEALAPAIWMPMRIDRGGRFFNSHRFRGIGLLSEAATPESAATELARLRDRLPERFPDAYSQGFFDQYGFRTQVGTLRSSVLGDSPTALWILFGGVGLVLLIACANVANLFLVRMEGRSRELSLRVALGADRSAVTRYVLSDGLVLAIVGGLLGLTLAVLSIPAVINAAPEALPRLEGVAVGLDTILFGIVVSAVAAIAISAIPVLSRQESIGSLMSGGRGSSQSRAQNRIRGVLVVSQIALAMTLLVGAGLLVQSLTLIRASDPGFDPEGVIALDLHATADRYPDDQALWLFHQQILDRVSALPGVTSVGMGEELPVAGSYGCTVQGFEDESTYDRVRAAGMTTCAGQSRVTPGYFETLGIPVLAGRALEPGDNDDPNRAAVVVSQAFADRFWPGEDPIGKGIGPGGRTIPPYYHVVGVVGDVAKAAEVGRPPLADQAIAVYYPGVYMRTENRWGGWYPGSMRLLVRTDNDPATIVPAVRRIVQELDPEIPVSNVRLMSDVVEEATTDVTFVSSLMVIAAMTALLLAAVGLYGVVSWVVSRRTREIGMRLAIGAHPSVVVRTVVGGTMRLAVLGLIVGLPLSFAASRVGESVLVGVSATSPLAYLSATALVCIVALSAAWIPARRAASVDPASSLRYD